MSVSDDHDRIGRIEDKIDALKELIDERFLARDKALEKVAQETERVRDQQNEWRQTINDVAGMKLGREEFDRAHDSLVTRVSALEQQLAGSIGTASGTLRIFMVGAVAISLIGLIVTIVHLVGGGG